MADVSEPGVPFTSADRFIVKRGGYVVVDIDIAANVLVQVPGGAARSPGDDAIGTQLVAIGPVPGGTAITISTGNAVAAVVRQMG